MGSTFVGYIAAGLVGKPLREKIQRLQLLQRSFDLLIEPHLRLKAALLARNYCIFKPPLSSIPPRIWATQPFFPRVENSNQASRPGLTNEG